jgi:arsenate reductase (glutaredoxin)
LLEDEKVEVRRRDLTKQPLTEPELRALLKKLGLRPAEVLRRKDPAFAQLQLTGDEPDEVLVGHMARHPGLLQRPIGVRGRKAVIGRPIETLLGLDG